MVNGPFENKEFDCLDAMRTARLMFFDDIVAHAQQHKSALISSGKPANEIRIELLRSENTFQVAEFYYLCEHFKLNDPLRMSAFIERHNEDMRELLQDPLKLRQQGLLPQRAKDAIFTDEQRAKVIENIVNGRLRLDQSDLGRFLSTIISPETCRKTLVALADGGCLERRNIGQVLVISTGILEEFYRKHLRRIVGAIKGTLTGKKLLHDGTPGEDS